MKIKLEQNELHSKSTWELEKAENIINRFTDDNILLSEVFYIISRWVDEERFEMKTYPFSYYSLKRLINLHEFKIFDIQISPNLIFMEKEEIKEENKEEKNNEQKTD